MKRFRHGFTLVELLVVIAIIGVLIALLLPAVQSARFAARNLECKNHLKQIGLAILNYADVHRDRLPASWRTFRNVEGNPGTLRDIGFGAGYWRSFSWRTTILPYMEQQPLHDQFDFDEDAYSEANISLQNHTMPVFQCPAREGYPFDDISFFVTVTSWPPEIASMRASVDVAGADYFVPLRYYDPNGDDCNVVISTKLSPDRIPHVTPAAWHGTSGDEQDLNNLLRAHLRSASFSAIADGRSNTILVFETTFPISGWVGCHPTAPPIPPLPCVIFERDGESFPDAVNRPGAMFSSHHSGANVAMCDGSVQNLSDGTDKAVALAMISRAGGEPGGLP